MKKIKISLFVSAMILLSVGSVSAQDTKNSVQQVNLTVGGSSMIKAVGNVSLSLSAGATQAGQSLLARSVDNTSRLRISSLTTTTLGVETKNQVTAKIREAGALYLTHTRLFLRLLDPSAPTNFINYGTAGGSLKNSSNQDVTVGTITQTLPVDGALLGTSADAANKEVLLANNIGFCWSGIESGDGYVIEYTYASTNDGTSQVPTGGAVTVEYTIAAQP